MLLVYGMLTVSSNAQVRKHITDQIALIWIGWIGLVV